MTCLRVAPIVEGHGEVAAIRVLLDRIWRELLGQEFIHVLRPIRRPRSKFIRHSARGLELDKDEITRAVRLADSKLQNDPLEGAGLILFLLDADEDCPMEVAPRIQNVIADSAANRIALVLPVIEYESWFVASADSLGDILDVHNVSASVIQNPELSRSGKSWIEKRIHGRYSETVDQPRLSARIDLEAVRSRSSSFAKLCRELEVDASPGHSSK